MNPFEMVVAIVAISAIAGVMRAKYGGSSRDEMRQQRREMRHQRRQERYGFMGNQAEQDPESERLREEVKQLKERIIVLERVITDTNSAAALDREIEKLR